MQKYIVLMSGAVIQFFLGNLYLWSVLVKPVSNHFNWDTEEAKLTASIMLGFFVLGVLLAGRLQLRFLTQTVTLLGGILFAAGMLASAFVPVGYGYALYVTYGMISGLGVGLSYNAIISTAQKWFPKNRGFAAGVSVSAFGFSAVVFAPLLELLTSKFDVTFVFIILAATFITVVLLLFRFVRMPTEAELEQKVETQQNTSPQTNKSAKKDLLAKNSEADAQPDYTTMQMLRTPIFYLITVSIMLGTSVFMIINPSIKTLAIERGLSSYTAILLVMLTGIANASGRLIIPLTSDKFGRESVTLFCMIGSALLAVSLCFAQGYALMLVIPLIALFYGGYSGIYPVITSDYFGMKYFGSNYGTVMLGFATSALTLPFVLHYIKPDFYKFITLACVASGAAIAMGTLLYLKITNRAKTETTK
ncbi:MAG: MFS transporter [Thermoguttaceae bacterium]